MRETLACLVTITLWGLSCPVLAQGDMCPAGSTPSANAVEKPPVMKQEPTPASPALASTAQRQAAFLVLLGLLSGKK